jgi:hypothetical protein
LADRVGRGRRGDGVSEMNRPGLIVVVAALIAALASSPWT